MEKIFWTQIRDFGYQFSEVPAGKQAGVKALAVADVEAKVIDADGYEKLIGEKFEQGDK